MQTLNQIQDFTCQLHPSEVIKRVCLDSTNDFSLKCIQCLLNDFEKVSKNSLITFDEFIDNAAQQYQTFTRTSFAFENGPPNEFLDFLAQENENIQNLSQHVEQEKYRVNNAFDNMVQEFTQLCIRKKNEIAFQLDKQLVTLKFNYTYYKGNLDKYYNLQKKNSLNPDKETLINRINQCKDANEAEVLVKNIKDDLLMASSNEEPEHKIHQIKEGFKSIAQMLQEQAKALPKTRFCDQTETETSLDDFREAVGSLMDDLVKIDDKISELSFSHFLSIDSKLIQKPEDLNLLKTWLAPSHKDFDLKLLYRGSRDGMNCEAFHQKCDGHAPTLTIVKSHNGKKFGGYTYQTWDYSPSVGKPCYKSWLFSLDEKLKFPIKAEGSQYAIYSYDSTFGFGYDLNISLSHKKDQKKHSKGGFTTRSSSTLGKNYLMNLNPKIAKRIAGDQELSNIILAGSSHFALVELEVYSIAKQNKPEFESEIINPQQDLDLIKSWLGPGKNHQLELIYRSSRDGSSVTDFHLHCDDKGPTLMICKSKDGGRVFGGFTSKNWSCSDKFVEDQDAFLFSLTHSTKHPIINKDYAIGCSAGSGPIFGGNPNGGPSDLYICFHSYSHSALGTSYQASESPGERENYLAGYSNFYIDEIEVFTVKSN